MAQSWTRFSEEERQTCLNAILQHTVGRMPNPVWAEMAASELRQPAFCSSPVRLLEWIDCALDGKGDTSRRALALASTTEYSDSRHSSFEILALQFSAVITSDSEQ